MSCFVMNPEPLAALANAIEARLNCDYGYWGFEAPDSLYRELDGCRRAFLYSAEEIYRRLYAVNVRAYNGRYAAHEEPEDEEAPEIDVSKYIVHHGPKYREHGFAVQPWHYQFAKLLDCWLYQTLEDATHNDPLRLAVKDFRNTLHSFIVANNQEYTTAQWGEFPSAQHQNKEQMIDITAEYEFLTGYVTENCFDEEICCDRLRMLWTAFCLHHGLDADTHVYDCYLSKLWKRLQEAGDGTSEWTDFGGFENFMCAYLV